MVLLALELSGNATSNQSYLFTLRHTLTYSKATLCGIDLHAPSPELSESWSNTQTGDDYPQSRTAYAPLYADIDIEILEHRDLNTTKSTDASAALLIVVHMYARALGPCMPSVTRGIRPLSTPAHAYTHAYGAAAYGLAEVLCSTRDRAY